MRLAARLIVGLAAAGLLAACAADRPPDPRLAIVDPPPVAADGLWAVLEPGCQAPRGRDPGAWPACASAVWLNGGEARVVRSLTSAHERSYAARLQIVAGTPLIAKVGVDGSGSLFIALADLARDDRGRLIAAEAAPIACVEAAARLRASLNDGGCDRVTPEALRDAAQVSLSAQPGLMRVAWIGPGAPS